MSLTAAEVAEIMRLVEQSTFDELTLETNGTKLTLRRGSAGVSVRNDKDVRNDRDKDDSDKGASDIGDKDIGDKDIGDKEKGDKEKGDKEKGAREKGASRKGANDKHVSPPSAARASAAQATAPGEAATRAAPPTAATPAPPIDPSLHDVPSPLLGTFYRSPKPGAPPFVEPGSQVEENTIVAIIEVMKLMNTVRAGVRGTVTEIFPLDGTLVEYDQPLLRIRKTT